MKKNIIEFTIYQIKEECKELLLVKNIDLEELSFKLGISPKDFLLKFKNTKDFTFFLETYHVLLDW